MMPTLFNGKITRPWGMDPSFQRAFRDMDALINATFRGLEPPAQSSVYGLKVLEREDDVVLTMALPGVSQEEVELTVVERELTLKVEGKSRVPEGFRALRRERRPVNFWRKFTLPETLSTEDITAEMKDGLLRVTLAKRPESKPRRIDIQVKG